MARFASAAIGSIAAALLVFLPGSAQAQAAHFRRPTLTFFPAGRVLDIPASGVLSASLDGIALTRLPRVPAAALKALRGGFELRVFRISNPQSLPTAWKKNLDRDCDVYLSLVIKNVRFNASTAVTPHLTRAWLSRDAQGHETDGFFLVVLEAVTRDDPHKLDQWEIFRVSKTTAANYFARGVVLEVAVPRGSGRPVLYPDYELEIKNRLNAVAGQVSASYDCYKMNPVQLASLDGSRLALDQCAASSPSASALTQQAGARSESTEAGSLDLPWALRVESGNANDP
ncbi:MAG: hypothetical protein QOH04_2283 [Sphingomonadales bacterium]|jgi:hypothetical protein|nr:hypothetical protein [Sphingomonadales bacterium]